MANMADITAYDDAATPVATIYKPVTDTPVALWRERNTTKSDIALERLTMMSDPGGKSGLRRRYVKLEVPVMEQASGAAADGNVAPPKVAHTMAFVIAAYVHPRATADQIANGFKKAYNIATGVATAGTGNAFKNATDPGRALIILDERPS